MITVLLLVRATYILVLFFSHIPFVVNRTFNATPTERLQNYSIQQIPQDNCMQETFCRMMNWKYEGLRESKILTVTWSHSLMISLKLHGRATKRSGMLSWHVIS